MYLRMRLNKWSDIEATIGLLKIPVKLNNSIGYMEVYENVEDLKKDYPKEKYYIEVEETKKMENV